MTKKWQKLELFFLIFFAVFRFSVFSEVYLPIMTCLLFREHLDTLLTEGNFSLYLYVFEILKKLVTFPVFQ